MSQAHRPSATLATIALLIAPAARAASAIENDPLLSAARELARKTAAFLVGRIPAETWHNRSSLADSELERVRREFRSTIPGTDPAPNAPVPNGNPEIHVTLSENGSQYLLIEEARTGEDAQTWVAAWKRDASAAPPPALALDRELIWEQNEPILDLAVWNTGLLVLSPSSLSFYERQGAQWALRRQLPLALPHAWPRDPRARLRRTGSQFEMFLPGTTCHGDTASSLSLECHPSSDPWVLDSASRSLLLAAFAPDRNYFDGRVVLQEGSRKSLPPFYSAAALEQPGGTSWLLALADGQTEIFNSEWEPAGSIPSWGSDIVALNGCGVGSQVLTSRGGDVTQPDVLQTFSISNGAALPASAPMPAAGSVTALWPASTSGALAVVFDPVARKYRAYVVTLVCGS